MYDKGAHKNALDQLVDNLRAMGPSTAVEVANRLGIDLQYVRLRLNRAKDMGKVRTTGVARGGAGRPSHVWEACEDAPAPKVRFGDPPPKAVDPLPEEVGEAAVESLLRTLAPLPVAVYGLMWRRWKAKDWGVSEEALINAYPDHTPKTVGDAVNTLADKGLVEVYENDATGRTWGICYDDSGPLIRLGG